MIKVITLLTALLLMQFVNSQCADLVPQIAVNQSQFCGPGPHTVTLTNNSSGINNTTSSYDWFLDGNLIAATTGLTAPPTFQLTTPGTYTIQLEGTDSNPCTASATIQIIVRLRPIASFTFSPNSACATTIITFNNTSTNTLPGTTYFWNFGNGTSSTDANPTHSYPAGGNFNVTLIVTNPGGCSNSYATTVSTLNVPFLGGITGNDGDGNTINCLLPADPTTSQIVSFSHNTTGAINYLWNFGDGNTSPLPNPSHLYSNYGTYIVTLTVSGFNGCAVTDTLTVVFEEFVSASLVLDITEYSGCAPLPLTTLVNNSINASSFIWDFGDGSAPYVTTSQTPPNHVYTQEGYFTISLSASNSCNIANATISPIIVVAKPQVDFSLTGNNGCAPASIGFVNNTTGTSPANAYTWDMGNGNTYNTTVTPPLQNYTNSGVYTVSLRASNACGDSILTQAITLDTIPLASFDLLPDEGCSPLTVDINNTSIGNITDYRWDRTGYGYSYGPTYGPFIYTYPPGNTPVTQDINLMVSNHCGSTSVSETVTIHRPTQALFTSSTTEICLGADFTFTNQSLGEDLTFEWDFGDGSTSTAGGPHTINYTTPDTFDIRLIAIGYCGNDTMIQTVIVHPQTIADMIPLDPIDGCSPMEISFQNNSTGANLTYEWRVDGVYAGNSADIGPLNFIETPGNAPVNHTVQLTVNSSCGTETTETIVTVHRPTEANMTVTPTEVCLGESIVASQSSLGENLTYEWSFGDGNTSSLSGPITIDYSLDGTYEIQLVALGYCGNDTVRTTAIVHPFPIADFSPDIPDGCEILEMTFTNNSTPTASQNWSFGPNASLPTSTDFDPGTVYFPNPGVEQIILIVEENGCESRDTNYIEVFPLPVLIFDLIPNEGCSELEIQFNNSSINNGVETFTWNFGNGNTYVGYSPPNETFIAIGNDSIYTIQLNVISGSGCRDSITHQAIVHPVPLADFDFVEDSICQNSIASFTNNSTTGMSYEWEFGDGNTSNTINPTHQYANDGTYIVRLVVNSPFTCSDTITKEIVVHPIPEALFIATTACFGYETVFTDQSIGNNTDWNWTFGDGNSSTDQHPTHLYSSAGSYTAELTVTNNFNCVTSLASTVNVNETPIADFLSDDYCLGDATTFSNLTTGTTTGMEWNFGDGSALSTDINPNHTYTLIGVYDVRLVAFDGSGCSDTIIHTLTINPVPVADFSFLTVCANDTTFFTDISSGNPDNFTWDFGDGTIDNTNNPNPSNVYTNDGTYNVTLTVDYALTGCNNSISYNVDAHPRTTPQFNATTACFNIATDFTDATLNNPGLWEWDFGDGSVINTTQNPSHTYTAPGTYNVELVTENIFGCSDTIVQSVVVNILPTAGFDFDTVCLNAATNFTDLSVDAIGWEYNFGDGTTINANNTNHVFLTDGNHIVQQVVTNNLGCTDTLIQTIIVRPNPTAIFTTDIACFSYPTAFTNQSIDAVASQWTFNDLGVISTNNSPTYTYSHDGTFNPELVVVNVFGCTDTAVESALVLPQPIASFTNTTVCARDVVTFTNTSSGPPTLFEWDFGDGSGIFTTEHNTHIFANGGIYDVTLIVGNASGCSDTLVESIEVYTVPEVSFVADTACLYSVTQFNELSSDLVAISNWDWDFGDGNTSPLLNPSYIYQNSGFYNVSLTVTNINGCDSTFSDQILVSLVPVADFNFVTDCFGSPTIFTDLSTNFPGIYIWDFGDGTIINGGPYEEYTYSTPGIYIVELKTFGSDSVCSTSKLKIVHVSAGAEADFLIPAQVCVNDVFNFYDNSSTTLGVVTGYQWIISDGTTYDTPNGTHVFNTPGVYQFIVNISTSNGCSATHTESIDVLPATAANFEWSNTCSNTPTQFINTSTGGTTSWFWSFGDGTTSQTQFPTHIYTSEGEYSVMLIVQNLSGCADTIIQLVNIDPSPITDFLNDEVCYGNLTTFTNQSTISAGTIDSYQWIFGNNEGNSSLENPQYEFTTYAQNHPVTFIATSDKGCTDTIIKTVNLLPIIDFDFNLDDQFGCAPITVFFDNQSQINGAAILSYEWNFGDGTTSFQESPTHTFLTAGNYQVSLTVYTSTDCKIVTTDGLELEVFPSPTAAFDVNPPITSVSQAFIKITDESQGATMWEYDLGEGNYSNSPSLSHNYSEVGIYYITQFVQNNFGCKDSTQRAIEIQEDFTLYVPNAFTPRDENNRNDYFTWVISGFETFEMRIFNRWGELVFETKDPNGQWDGIYDGQKVKDGVYIWQVKAMDLNGDERVISGHVSAL